MAWAGSMTLMVVMPRARGGLEVDPEIIEEDRLGGLDRQLLARHLVERRIRLAHAHLARLDDPVEQGEHAAHLTFPIDVAIADDEVVREQPGDESLGAPPHRLHHLRAQLARQEPDDVATHDLVAGGTRLGLEQQAELVERHLTALELRPRIGVGVRRVQLPDQAVGQAPFLLVARERLERRRQDDATEVEQRGANGRHDRRSRAVAPHSSVDRTSESMSIRSLSPWNIVP